MSIFRLFFQSLSLCTTVLFLTACGSNIGASGEQSSQQSAQNTNNAMSVARQEVNKSKMTDNIMTIKGQIVYQTMEGGFYSFIADNGDKYTPMPLAKEYRRHGLIVEVKAEEMLDVMTTTQFGKVIKIHEISVLDESKVSEIDTKL